MVDSVEEVLRILDNSLPDVVQVIEVPKIILDLVPQRSSLLEPQMVEQLVEVPWVSPTRVLRAPEPQMESQLVAVPPTVSQ